MSSEINRTMQGAQILGAGWAVTPGAALPQGRMEAIDPAPGAQNATAQVLLALSWLLRRPGLVAALAGRRSAVNGTARVRRTRGRLATDPGA